MQDNSFISNEIVQEILDVKQTRAYAVIREMLEIGLIVKGDDYSNECVLKI
ncbi:MAG: hypothetical protein FWG90_04960 [Oscillospiraceae bacterium]|nr:hypothetical protein [Oscillospiraceae bacterium]